jgi:cytochrome c oxidase subunit II
MNWFRTLTLPAEGSTLARDVDNLYVTISVISAFFFLLVAGLIGWSVLRYRRKAPNERTPHITHHLGLELAWSIIPLCIVIAIFFWGFHGYMRASVSPGNSMEIVVTAKKWVWQFEYPDGMRTLNDIHVPLNKPVKLIMTSEDVIHSFYVPSFRVKMDVVPGRYTEIWFTPTKEGMHQVLCTEYCGKGHSEMLAKVWVDNDAAYKKWVEEGDEMTRTMPLKELGKIMYENKGCNTCHSLDGRRGDGPSFKGVFGKTEKMSDGTVIKIDENYIRQSILQPQAHIVASFEGIMPTFQGLLREREIQALVEFVKSQQ